MVIREAILPLDTTEGPFTKGLFLRLTYNETLSVYFDKEKLIVITF